MHGYRVISRQLCEPFMDVPIHRSPHRRQRHHPRFTQ
jgi:hypothetical protein